MSRMDVGHQKAAANGAKSESLLEISAPNTSSTLTETRSTWGELSNSQAGVAKRR